MKLGIVGSRDFDDEEFIFETIKLYGIKNIDLIVSGGCKGPDLIAEKFAKENNIGTLIFKPDWKKYGRAAGPIRNKSIIENSDELLVFWDGKSKGTLSSIQLAQTKKIKIQIKYI